MPPALPMILAGIHWLVSNDKSWTIAVYVIFNMVVFAWVACQVARSTLVQSNLSSLRLLNWSIPLSIFVVFLANFNDNFQRTHDGTWLLLVMHLTVAVAIAFAIQTPWLIRNYVQFSKFVPVKTNGLFELEQSLLRDDDGVVDFGIDLHHPYVDRKEAKMHAEMGEVSYVKQRVQRLREKFWDRKWIYAEHCCNRLFAMFVWQMPLTPGEERFT